MRSLNEIDWREQVLADVNRVYQAGKALGVSGAHAECAIAAWQAVLAHDTSATDSWVFSSLVGLQSMLVATGRTGELISLLDSAATSGSGLGRLGRLYYILDAVMGTAVEAQASEVADSLRAILPSLSETRLWFLAIWDVYRGRVVEARSIRDTLRSRATEGSRRADLMAEALTAHITLVEGDTAGTLGILTRLVPNGPRTSYAQPWESLGLERLTLARILCARGDYAEVHRVATVFDSPGGASVIFPVFLAESLELRMRAAEAMGDRRLAAQLRDRLRGLGRENRSNSQPSEETR